MAGDAFRKVRPGERLRLPAAAWNAFLDAAKQVRAASGAEGIRFERWGNLVRVKNNSGGAVDQFGILGIDEPIITPTADESNFKGLVTFTCTTPAAGDEGKFVVCVEPIPTDGFGRAVASGLVIVRLTGADVGWATITASDKTKLTAAYSGTARVLWAEAGSSERWAVVRLGDGPPATLRGKLDGALSYQGSATMSVWYHNGSAETDTTNNVTVYDWLLSTGQSIASGKQVTAAWDPLSKRYYVIGAQCA